MQRKSGILVHITSLPSKEGIGTLGQGAYDFVDFLVESKQSLWQILPIGPTLYGDSPYSSSSAFAGNPLLIDLNNLSKRKWASKKDIKLPEYINPKENVDYGSVVYWKIPTLYKCAEYFLKKASSEDLEKYSDFCKKNDYWLEDWALFQSIKSYYEAKAQKEHYSGNTIWNEYWPKSLAKRKPQSLSIWKSKHSKEMENIKVVQFFFYTQMTELKQYCNSKGIKIVGDIPIFVASDSADLWSNQQYFQFGKTTLQQTAVAGVPPDYFSATGQLWGNPLYYWKALKKDNYSWWCNRINNMMNYVDIIRIDHFRGFESYWKIPYGEKTAINGVWEKGPGIDLFNSIKEKCPNSEIIAEDLGVITKKVENLRNKCDFPGMKILQFAFNDHPWDKNSAKNPYLPRKIKKENCVIYTGTHDNDTTMGLLSSVNAQFKKNICNYLKIQESSNNEKIAKKMIKICFLSKAKYCIIPLQDVLLLGNEARMNLPGSNGCNWSWRFSKHMLKKSVSTMLSKLSDKSNRN